MNYFTFVMTCIQTLSAYVKTVVASSVVDVASTFRRLLFILPQLPI